MNCNNDILKSKKKLLFTFIRVCVILLYQAYKKFERKKLINCIQLSLTTYFKWDQCESNTANKMYIYMLYKEVRLFTSSIK